MPHGARRKNGKRGQAPATAVIVTERTAAKVVNLGYVRDAAWPAPWGTPALLVATEEAVGA